MTLKPLLIAVLRIVVRIFSKKDLVAIKTWLSLRPAFKKSDSSLKMKRQEGVKKFRKREKDLVK